MNIKELVSKYNLTRDDAWQLPQNKAIWILTHSAVEKIANIENITLKNIQVVNSERDFVRFIMTMTDGKRDITDIGEAMKENCTSKYYGCIGFKRGWDRCVLKLINASEHNIYSDIESDDFKRS